MKEALKKLADKMHQADPEAGFAFEFWDGDRVCYGDLSRSSAVTLRFKSAETAKDVLTDGFPGFGEAYMAGDLEVAGDLKGFIPAFMRKVDQLLNRGGLGLLHTIGKDRASGSDPWIWKYIFPGNYLPTLAEIVREMGTVGFSVLDMENLRLHYACTMDRWAESFERNGGQVLERFDEAFFRMWRLYLRGAAAGFRYGELRVFQVLFSKGLNNDLPLTRDHVYCR